MDLPAPLSRILPGTPDLTPPLIGLIAANGATILFAVIGNWDLATVLFSYWVQSIIIGIFAAISILACDTRTLLADMNRSAEEGGNRLAYTPRSVAAYKGFMAGFFCLHYGLFHWGYYSFIVDSGIFGPVNMGDTGLLASSVLFLASHGYSWYWHRRGERQGAQFVTEEFFRPYNRIIPMHLIIIFGSIIVLVLEFIGITTVLPVLVLFLFMKTWMDIRMHLRKHYEEEHPDEPVQLIGF